MTKYELVSALSHSLAAYLDSRSIWSIMRLDEFVMSPQGIPLTCRVAHILKVTCELLRTGRWLPGSSHVLDLKSTMIFGSECGVLLWLELLVGLGVLGYLCRFCLLSGPFWLKALD